MYNNSNNNKFRVSLEKFVNAFINISFEYQNIDFSEKINTNIALETIRYFVFLLNVFSLVFI